MVKRMQQIDYYHLWNTMNLNVFIVGWILIWDSFKNSNILMFLIGTFAVIIISISIFYQNKLERDLL